MGPIPLFVPDNFLAVLAFALIGILVSIFAVAMGLLWLLRHLAWVA